jgi:YgiT-type zinc finger domain-containing protein
MECLHCQGTLVRKTVNYTANRKGYHLIIDDVPAWVWTNCVNNTDTDCEQCGEPLFDEETVDAIQKALQEVDTQLNHLPHLPSHPSFATD